MVRKRRGTKSGTGVKRTSKKAIRRDSARPAPRPLRGAPGAPTGERVATQRPDRTIRRAKRTRLAGAPVEGERVVFRYPELLEEADRLDVVTPEALKAGVTAPANLPELAPRFARALKAIRSRLHLPAKVTPEAIERAIARVELLTRLEGEAAALYEKYRNNRSKVANGLWKSLLDAWALVDRVAGYDPSIAQSFTFMGKETASANGAQHEKQEEQR